METNDSSGCVEAGGMEKESSRKTAKLLGFWLGQVAGR